MRKKVACASYIESRCTKNDHLSALLLNRSASKTKVHLWIILAHFPVVCKMFLGVPAHMYVYVIH